MKHSALLLLLASPAVADELVLHNGARFSGLVTRDKGRVHIRMEAGEMTFAAVDVASIRRSEDPLLEVERRASTASTAPECHDAAVFAAEKGFKAKAAELHLRAVERDPEHEGSRRALGHVKHDGRWKSLEELGRELGWVKPTPVDRVESSAEARLEAAARERELERQRRAQESFQDAILSIELDRLDLERARLEQERKLESRRQRLEQLQPPALIVTPAFPSYAQPGCGPPRPAKRFQWPIWGN